MAKSSRLVFLVLMPALAACMQSGPVYSPQELAAVRNVHQVNFELAQNHKITWAEASRREIVEANRIAGPRMDDQTRLAMAYKLALAAEVDAGRMTPEMMDFRYREKLEQDRATAAAQDAERRREFGEAMMLAGQAMQAGAATYQGPLSCSSNTIGGTTFTNCN